MKKEEINLLFAQLAKKIGVADENAKQIFAMFITTTLNYRDDLKKQNLTLTVRDTQEALDLFIEALKTKRVKKTENRHALNLVKIWLDEVKKL